MDTSFGNLEICTPMEPFRISRGGFISEGYGKCQTKIMLAQKGFVFESSAVENEIEVIRISGTIRIIWIHYFHLINIKKKQVQ